MVYVHAGNLFVSAAPHLVKTVLGSCVAACLWDETTGIGGLIHYQLPRCPAGDLESLRYGDVAIRQLLQRLAALGARREEIRGKVFGGARVVQSDQSESEHLGTRNISAAFQILQSEGITVVGEDVGGPRGRSIGFQTDDGIAWVRKV